MEKQQTRQVGLKHARVLTSPKLSNFSSSNHFARTTRFHELSLALVDSPAYQIRMADDVLIEGSELAGLRTGLREVLPKFGDGKSPLNAQRIDVESFKRSDRSAAWEIYIELSTRVISKELPFRDGEEKSALDSVYAFFKEARATLRKHPGAVLTAVIVTSLLNTVIRKFTAKWHALSVAGQLSGNDDCRRSFRSELESLQMKIAPYGEALRVLAGDFPPPLAESKELTDEQPSESPQKTADSPPQVSTKRKPGIPLNFSEVESRELKRIQERRGKATKFNLCGVSFSGGGIRAAATCLGFAQGLKHLWQDVDYLSTVSGGGYIGALIHQELNQTIPRAEDEPFLKGAAQHARDNSNYLTRSVWDWIALSCWILYGLFLNLFFFVWMGVIGGWAISCIENLPIDPAIARPWLAGGAVAILGALLLLSLWIASRLDHRLPFAAQALRFLARVTAFPLLIALTTAVIVWFEFFQTSMRGPDRFVGFSFSSQNLASVCLVGAAALFIGAMVWRSNWSGFIQILLGTLPRFIVVGCVVGGGYLFDWILPLLDRLDVPFQACDPLVKAALCLVVGLLVPGLFRVNWASPHGFYRRRLKRGFLNRNRLRKVKKVSCDGVTGPYPLFNATVNLPLLTTERLWDRRSDSFIFSPLAFGSRVTGYYTADDFEARNGGFDLASAMAVSGAAFAPNMGKLTLPYARKMLCLFNIRLSYWLKKPSSFCLWPCHPGYLIRDLMGWYDGSETYLNVSDGGHFENLGLYELLKRRVNYIVAFDFQADPLCRCDEFAKLICYARNDFGVDIDIDWSPLKPNENGISYRHFVVGHIYYPDDPTRVKPGILVYIKPTLTGNEEPDVRAYKVISPQFPFHPLSDQVFDEIQFEAYRSLGEHIARDLIRWGRNERSSPTESSSFVAVLSKLEDKLGPEKPTPAAPLESSPDSPNL